MLAPFRRIRYHVQADTLDYPWNYFGEGWPAMIGVPRGNPNFRINYGDSLRPSGVYPSSPWFRSIGGLTGSQTFLSEEFLPPPEGYTFHPTAPETGDETTYEDREMVLSAGPDGWGRYRYTQTATKIILTYKLVVAIEGWFKKSIGIAPIIGALVVLGGLMLAGASTSPTPARRRRKS